MLDVYAYTDESGNTGNNVFDQQQPYFWTGTLLSDKDIDKHGKEMIESLCNQISVEELHGNHLGLYQIDKIADKLENFIIENEIRFIFTQIEKEYVVETKFVDTLMDSGINKAVSPIHYGNKFLRLLFTQDIIINLDFKSKKLFWNAFETGNISNFLIVLRKLKTNIIENVFDERKKTIIIDAINWGLRNPEPLLKETRSELDAPNSIAISLLLGSIQNILKDTEFKISKFIHDEQNQFAKSIKQMYEIHQKIKFPSNFFSWITDLEDSDVFLGPLNMASSNSSPGLQLIDIILWITKRRFENNWGDYSNCNSLFNTIKDISLISIFSLEEVMHKLDEAKQTLLNKPLSQEQLEKGKQLVKEIEEKRKIRMKENSPHFA